jgi:sulfur carrier protein ThiS adenylyltransferase
MTFKEIKKILKRKKIGIAGCGGLGSNCAVALARIGIGKLVIADFDVVRKSNLNRQYYFTDQLGQKKVFALEDNLFFINSVVKIESHDVKLNPQNIVELFNKCDIIIEAFDDAEMKQMIIETVLDKFPNKPIISGMGMAGFGNNNSMRMEQHGNLYVCGDMQTEVADNMPPLAPRVGIVAMMQANQAVEILLASE